MSFAGDLADFGSWWLSEARQSVQRLTSRHGQASDYTLRVGRAAIRLDRPRGGEKAESILDNVDQLPGYLKSNRSRPARVELVLEDNRYLERPLSPFRLARTRARDMALLDLQSSTPLDPSNCVILFPRFPEESGSSYFVARRRLLEPLIKTIEGTSGKLASIKLQTGRGIVEVEPADYRNLMQHARRDARISKLTVAALTAVLIGAVGTFGHAQWRYARAERQLDAEIDALEAEAKEVRALLKQREQQVQQIAGVRKQRQQAVPVVGIWGELTRAMPDTAWVSDLSIKGGKVRVSGFSQSAAGLIATLEASPLFASPTFGAPVVKAPDVDKERFSIDMELQR